MVFFALCAQCASTLVIIGRELSSWLADPSFQRDHAYVAALGVAAARAPRLLAVGLRAGRTPTTLTLRSAPRVSLNFMYPPSTRPPHRTRPLASPPRRGCRLSRPRFNVLPTADAETTIEALGEIARRRGCQLTIVGLATGSGSKPARIGGRSHRRNRSTSRSASSIRQSPSAAAAARHPAIVGRIQTQSHPSYSDALNRTYDALLAHTPGEAATRHPR